MKVTVTSSQSTSNLLDVVQDTMSQISENIIYYSHVFSAVEQFDRDPAKLKHGLTEIDKLMEVMAAGLYSK